MSEALYYRPLSDGQRIGNFQLRDCIEKYFGLPCKINYSEDNEYINGLSDAGVEGAKELLDALEKFEEIELWKSSLVNLNG